MSLLAYYSKEEIFWLLSCNRDHCYSLTILNLFDGVLLVAVRTTEEQLRVDERLQALQAEDVLAREHLEGKSGLSTLANLPTTIKLTVI